MNNKPEQQNQSKRTEKAFKVLYDIIQKLRSKKGCPWDRKQTPSTLKKNLLEETYEAIDAINKDDHENIKEELGDLFLLITMISYMYEQKNIFTVDDVLNSIQDKLIRRHPHVFGDINIEEAEEVIINWNKIKETEKKQDDKNHNRFNNIPNVMPPLEQAYQVQREVQKVGFDWTNVDNLFDKLDEEIKELKNAIAEHTHKSMNNTTVGAEFIEEELGDVLFTTVNLCRFLKTNPVIALNKTIQKFKDRFLKLEQELEKSNRNIQHDDISLQEMDKIWNSLK